MIRLQSFGANHEQVYYVNKQIELEQLNLERIQFFFAKQTKAQLAF